jgi:hypothetical protein
MRYKYWILMGLMWLSAAASGQGKVSRTDFERTVDYMNCELAKFFMEQQQAQYELDNYKNIEAQYGRSYEQLMVFIKSKQPQMLENGELAAQIETYKAQYDAYTTNDELYNALTEVFKEPLLDAYTLDDGFGILKEKLKATLLTDLKVNEIEETPMLPAGERWYDFRQWEGQQMALLAAGLIAFLVLLKAILWFRKYTQSSEIPQSLPTTKKQASNQPTVSINDAYADKKMPVAPEIPSLEAIREESMSRAVVMPQADELPTSEEIAIEMKKQEQTQFYMPYPSLDGTFYQHNSTESQKIDSAFHFTIKLAAYGLATFEVVSSEKVMTDIFMDFEGTLKPACEVERDSKIAEGMNRVITVEAGIVQKRSGEQHWRLKQKVRVRFEY